MSKFLSNLLAKGTLTVEGVATLGSSTQIGGSRLNVHNIYGAATFGNGGTGTDITALTIKAMGTGGSVNFQVLNASGAQLLGTIEDGYILAGATFRPSGGRTGFTFDAFGTSPVAFNIIARANNLSQVHRGLLVTEGNLNGIAGGNFDCRYVEVAPIFNATGGETYNVRGFYYNPSITNLSATTVRHIAWENTSGDIIHRNLSGTGTRMVVADPDGKLSVQSVPSFSESDTLDSVTTRGAITTNTISVGGMAVGQTSLETGTKLTVNGATYLKNGYLYGVAANGGDFGLYPDGGYYEFSSPTGANQGPILILNCRYTGKQVGFYAGDTTYPGMLLYEQAPVGGDIAYWALDKWAMTPSQKLVWAATSGGIAIAQGPYDLGISKEAAGLLQVNNGTIGTYASLKALNLTATGNATVAGELVVNSRFTVGSYDSGSGGTNINTYLELKNFNNDAYGEGLVLAYSRGTMAAPQNVQTGDVIGGLYYRAHSGGAPRNASYIESVVSGVGTYAKTKLVFATSADDSYPYVGMILNEEGKLFVGYNLVDQGAYRLQVGGAIHASGALLTSLAGTGSRMVVADASGTLSTTAIPGETDTLYTVTQRGNTTFGDIVVNGKGSFTDSVMINADPAYFSGSAYNGYKVLGIGSTTGGGLSFVSSNGVAAEVFGDNTATGLYLASYGAVPVITFWLNTTEVAKYKTNGDLLIANLAGTGTRMVVADATGTLSTQALPGGGTVSGTGTTNYVSKWTSSTALGNSTIFDDGNGVGIGTATLNAQTRLTVMGSQSYSKSIVLDSTWNYQTSWAMRNGVYSTEFNLGGSTKSTNEGGPGSLQISTYNATTNTFRYPMTFFANANVSFGGTTGSVPADNGSTVQVIGTVQASTLVGTGTRMVVASAGGVLGVQAIPTGSLQGAVDADKNTTGSLAVGTTTVKSVSALTYSGVFFDYVVKNGTNVRVGSVVAITNGTNVEFYETLSNDIGSTSGLTFTVTLGGGNMNLNAVAASTGFTVIVSTRAI